MAFSLRGGVFHTTLSGFGHALELFDDDNGPEQLQAVMGALAIRHHFGRGLSAELSAPAGTLRFVPRDDLTARTLSGLGDVAVTGRYELAALWGAGGFSPSVVVEAGLGLPTGTQARVGEVDGFFPPNLLSLGVAAFSSRARVNVTQFVHKRVALKGWLGAQVPLTESNVGVLNGMSADGGAGVTFVPLDWLWLTGQLSAQYRTPSFEREAGEILSSGGAWLAAEASAAVRLNDTLSAVVGVRVPTVAYVRGRQVSETVSGYVVLAATFGAGGDDHDHDHGGEHDHGDEREHEHGDEHEHEEQEHRDAKEQAQAAAPSGDVDDAARGGESFRIENVVVPGKVTVIDFWAEWCAPCHVLDRQLRALAATHEDLAVRRVEVPDFDCAAAQEHIATAPGLPVIWVYDRAGARVAEVSGDDVDGALAAVRDALAR